MRTISIESNGRIEKTAVYLNGEQITGIKELLLSIDEEGIFNAIISFTSSSGTLLTKQLFTDDLSQLQRREAAFSEDEAMDLRSMAIESDGTLDNTSVFMNNEFIDGIVSIMVHIMIDSVQKRENVFTKIFSKNQSYSETRFISEIVLRNPDGSESIESIF
ncbi:MAG: hypothetical protein LW818_06995 [Ignavibacteriae bacterium]|jgi:hypothetical protein|nr:hypothetical protein [Ignavibacteriota bacterium]